MIEVQLPLYLTVVAPSLAKTVKNLNRRWGTSNRVKSQWLGQWLNIILVKEEWTARPHSHFCACVHGKFIARQCAIQRHASLHYGVRSHSFFKATPTCMQAQNKHTWPSTNGNVCHKMHMVCNVLEKKSQLHFMAYGHALRAHRK